MHKFCKTQIKKGRVQIPTVNYGKIKLFFFFPNFSNLCILSHFSDISESEQQRLLGRSMDSFTTVPANPW